MKRVSLSIVVALILSIVAVPAFAQNVDSAAAWRALAGRLDPGLAVDVRLRGVQHFKATFIDAGPDAIVVQRKTRVPVPPEAIAYDSIASLSRAQSGGLS